LVQKGSQLSLAESFDYTDDIHPIDLVEHIAVHHSWEFDRIHDDQIAFLVEGQWRTYAITLAWSAYDQTLRLICTFEMEPPVDRMAKLYECLNLTNDMCWAGAFSFRVDQKLIINTAVQNAERFYPAFQLVTWAERTPKDAIQVAIAEAYGRA
jgi:hypothetical protein